MSKKKRKKNFSKKITYRKTDKHPLPEELTLPLTSPGIHIGRPDLQQGEYAGIPQQAEGNLLVVGGVGSGKTSGIAAPTLLTWGGTAFVVDVKGELATEYGRLYDEGVAGLPFVVFDPGDPETPSYDPFHWLTADGEENLSSNAQDLARAIIPDEPSVPDPFWTTAAQQVLTASLLFGFRAGLSFSETVATIVDTPITELCKTLAGCEDATVRMFVGEVGNNSKLAISIDRTLRNRLALFAADPCVAHAFRGEREGAQTFGWDVLSRCHVFLSVPLDKIDIWSPAVNLMVVQLFRSLERRPDKHSESGRRLRPVLLLLDELPRLGKLPMLATCLSTLRSRGVFAALFIQSLAQLDGLYGKAVRCELVDNCNFTAILRANDADTQQYLAELIGTRLRKQHGLAKMMDEHWNTTGHSWQTGELREHVIEPHELATLPDILFLTPFGFCRVEKLPAGSGLSGARQHALRSLNVCAHKRSDTAAVLGIFRNDGAHRLSTEKRLQNAVKRLKAHEKKRQKERRQIHRQDVTERLLDELSPETKGKAHLGRMTEWLADLAEDAEAVAWLRARAQREANPPGLLLAPGTTG